MSAYHALTKKIGAAPIHDILTDFAAEDGPHRFRDGQSITVAGVVVSSRTRTTKNNSLMAYVVVEDEIASIELLCFNRVIENCGSYMQVNLPVVVQGKLSVRDEKAPQIMCDSIYPLHEEGEALPVEEPVTTPTGTVYLRVPSVEAPVFRHVKLVLSMFEGESPVKIRVADTGKMLLAHCLIHPALIDELKECLGDQNVVVK